MKKLRWIRIGLSVLLVTQTMIPLTSLWDLSENETKNGDVAYAVSAAEELAAELVDSGLEASVQDNTVTIKTGIYNGETIVVPSNVAVEIVGVDVQINAGIRLNQSFLTIHAGNIDGTVSGTGNLIIADGIVTNVDITGKLEMTSGKVAENVDLAGIANLQETAEIVGTLTLLADKGTGSLNMSGGTVGNINVTQIDTTINITGGKITDTLTTESAVNISDTSINRFNVNGGTATITQSVGTTKISDIQVFDAKVILNDGTIREGKVHKNGWLEMHGGTISKGFSNNGTLLLHNGKVDPGGWIVVDNAVLITNKKFPSHNGAGSGPDSFRLEYDVEPSEKYPIGSSKGLEYYSSGGTVPVWALEGAIAGIQCGEIFYPIPNVNVTEAEEVPHDLIVTRNGKPITDGYSYDFGVLKFNKSGSYTVSNVDPATATENTMMVTDNADIKLTLDQVNIATRWQNAALTVEAGSQAEINLVNENILNNQGNFGVVNKNTGEDTEGSLSFIGKGRLDTKGSSSGMSGSMTIEDGVINTTGERTGISVSPNNSFVISGGVVKASGQSGISVQSDGFMEISGGETSLVVSEEHGYGFYNTGTTIISGGVVNSRLEESDGTSLYNYGQFFINGGIVNAQGQWSALDGITIGGGTVTAESEFGALYNTTINGGSVKVLSDNVGSAIPSEHSFTQVVKYDIPTEGIEVTIDNNESFHVPANHPDNNQLSFYLRREMPHQVTIKDGENTKTFDLVWDKRLNHGAGGWRLNQKGLKVDKNAGYKYNNDKLQFIESGTYTVSNVDPTSPTLDYIEIAPNTEVKLILDGVDIETFQGTPALMIEINSKAELVTKGKNTLRSHSNHGNGYGSTAVTNFGGSDGLVINGEPNSQLHVIGEWTGVYGGINIASGEINVTSLDEFGTAIQTNADSIISGGTINVTGGVNGIALSGITIEGGSLKVLQGNISEIKPENHAFTHLVEYDIPVTGIEVTIRESGNSQSNTFNVPANHPDNKALSFFLEQGKDHDVEINDDGKIKIFHLHWDNQANDWTLTKEIDKTSLQKLVEDARELDEADYTAATWKALQTALEVATKVLADKDATQKMIDDAEIELQATLDDLIPNNSISQKDKTLIEAALIIPEAKQYDGKVWPVTINEALLPEKYQDKITIAYEKMDKRFEEPQKNAGEYKVIVKIKGKDDFISGKGVISITPRVVKLTIIAKDKVYDGTTRTDGLSVTDHNIILDDDIDAIPRAAFMDKNVGEKKTIEYSLQLIGQDRDNYVLNDLPKVTGNIIPRKLKINVKGVDKEYDRTTVAQVTGTALDPLAGDEVTVSGTGNFTNKNASAKKAITYKVELGGADGQNYVPNYLPSASAAITPLEIILGIAANDKVYDGKTDAAHLLYVTSHTALYPEDDINARPTAKFATPDVEPNKLITYSLDVFGKDKGNYHLDPDKLPEVHASILEPKGVKLTPPAAIPTLPPNLLDDTIGGLEDPLGK